MYKEALNEFKKEALKIEGVKDVLIRGTSDSDKEITDGWSDLDFSIVFEKLDYKSHLRVRSLYIALKKKFKFKISITCVSETDFNSDFHHHGIKPSTYTSRLEKDSHSLLSIKPNRKAVSDFLHRISAYENLVYLVHDIRSNMIKMSTNAADIKTVTIHLIKRSKHTINNSLCVLEGYIGESIDSDLYNKYYQEKFPDYINKLKEYRKEVPDIIDTYMLEGICERIVNLVEFAYEISTSQINKLIKQQNG